MVIAVRTTNAKIITIGVYQYLSNSEMYGNTFMENIKKLYKYDGKCDYQQQYKAILEAEMVTITEGFTDNSPMSPGPSVTVKNTSARNSLNKISPVLDVKQKTAIHRMGYSKTKRNAIRTYGMLWYSIHKQRVRTKFTASVKNLFIIQF